MKKLSSLEEKELGQETDKIIAAGESLCVNTFEAGRGKSSSQYVDIYGICKDCRYFQFVRYEFMGQKAACGRYESKLSGSQRIVECNGYDANGQMSLNQMVDIAWDLGYLTKPTHRRAGMV